MTRLLIDGKEVRLPADFTLDYYVYNPFFERKGNFTYDIDINLKDADNAKIYLHLNRWNNNLMHANRSAELWVDEQCIVKGTEVILSTEGDTVKIQIVAGNSELNYLVASDDLCIRDLDLGTCDLNVDTAKESLFHSGTDWDFVCPPIARVQRQFAVGWYYDENIAAGKFYNNLLRPGHNEGSDTPRNDYDVNFASRSSLRAQPYLAAIVERVVRALGYNVTYNHLRIESVFSKVYIVNAVETTAYNAMIPNWSVNKLLTEVEKWCSVLFLIDQSNKSCRIIPISDYYSSAGDINILKSKVQDEFEKKFGEEVTKNIAYRNIAYNLPDSIWYKYASLGSAKLSQFTKVYEGRTLEDMLENKIIYVKDGCEFVGRKWDTATTGGGIKYYLMPVEFLAEYVTDNSEEKTEFNIVPAEVIGLSLSGRYWTGEGNNNASIPCVSCIPYASSQGDSDKEEDEYATTSLIENTQEGDALKSSELMSVAIYNGMWQMFCSQYTKDRYPYIYNNLKWPISTVTNVTAAYTANDGTYLGIIFPDNGDLRPRSLYERIYRNNYIVSTDRIYKAYFFSDEILDAGNYFIIANRRLYCRFLHYIIDAKGVKDEVEGEFFPVQ